jgi:hypothetical protein
MTNPDEVTSPGEFAEQLIRQLYADLDEVLLADDAEPTGDDAFTIAAAAAAAGQPRGATLVVLLQAARAAHAQLTGIGSTAPPAPDAPEIGQDFRHLLAQSTVEPLIPLARRLIRYAGETEPAAPPLPLALAEAIRQLYEGMSREDFNLGSTGLIALRTLLVHIDAIAGQLDPAETEDRPIRVLPPDRFHDYFLKLTERVQQAGPEAGDRPVAALTRDGRLTAVVTTNDHPLEAAAQAVRDSVPGDALTREHALLRMQGLLRLLDHLRGDPDHPFAAALSDELWYLSLVTAAATAPMASPGRFSWAAIGQVARHNRNLLLMRPGGPSAAH